MSYREDVALAIRRVFQLGQTYWQQADSESYRENNKSDVTLEKYRATLAETSEIAARADARVAELEQAVTVRDTEIARLETDLELARRDGDRYRWLRDQHWDQGVLCVIRPRDAKLGTMTYSKDRLDGVIDTARAGNGGDL